MSKYYRFKGDERKLVVCPRCKGRRISSTLVLCSTCRKDLTMVDKDWRQVWAESQRQAEGVSA